LCKAVALYCVYAWLAPAHPRTRGALIVAAIGAVVMELTRPLFAYYVTHFAHYGAVYGSITAVVVSLVYLYLLMTIFLMGATALAESNAASRPAP
jgi:membrane protein